MNGWEKDFLKPPIFMKVLLFVLAVLLFAGALAVARPQSLVTTLIFMLIAIPCLGGLQEVRSSGERIFITGLFCIIAFVIFSFAEGTLTSAIKESKGVKGSDSGIPSHGRAL